MTNNKESVASVIGRSSLGTSAAKKLRARTTSSQRARVRRTVAVRTARQSDASVTKSKRQ